MPTKPGPENQNMGMFINSVYSSPKKSIPDWANRLQREKWTKRGVVLWKDSIQQITNISALGALRIIEYLDQDEEWKQNGIVVGEPALRISIDEPEKEGEWVLIDEVPLYPDEAGELLEFLKSNSGDLEILAEKEKKEGEKILAQLYFMIIAWSKKSKNTEQTE